MLSVTVLFHILQFSGQGASPEMINLLRELRKKVVVGFLGGSDMVKQAQQLEVEGVSNSQYMRKPKKPLVNSPFPP